MQRIHHESVVVITALHNGFRLLVGNLAYSLSAGCCDASLVDLELLNALTVSAPVSSLTFKITALKTKKQVGVFVDYAQPNGMTLHGCNYIFINRSVSLICRGDNGLHSTAQGIRNRIVLLSYFMSSTDQHLSSSTYSGLKPIEAELAGQQIDY